MARVLHLLCQRPLLTGSGVTLDALVRQATAAGWEQRVVVGVPAAEEQIAVGGLPPSHVAPLRFDTPALPFAVPGMSDVMPYPSTRFSAMTQAQLALYREAWRTHVTRLVESFAPEVIHAHHIWLLSALIKDVAPHVPVVAHCHATDLRQMELCPHLAAEVRGGCRRIERFAALHDDHRTALSAALDIDEERVTVVGAGYDEQVFGAQPETTRNPYALLYVGKLAHAKGLPWLLQAFDRLHERDAQLVLHVAGSGSGAEANALHEELAARGAAVHIHGQLPQAELAALMRRCRVCVLPSFYEGLPLVLAEAYACGCAVVATALPGVVSHLAPFFGPDLQLVALPELRSIDQPQPEAAPAFVARLVDALKRALTSPPPRPSAVQLVPFTWHAVFARTERIWRELIGVHPGVGVKP